MQTVMCRTHMLIPDSLCVEAWSVVRLLMLTCSQLLGIARGLRYLHGHALGPIYHEDVRGVSFLTLNVLSLHTNLFFSATSSLLVTGARCLPGLNVHSSPILHSIQLSLLPLLAPYVGWPQKVLTEAGRLQREMCGHSQ